MQKLRLNNFPITNLKTVPNFSKKKDPQSFEKVPHFFEKYPICKSSPIFEKVPNFGYSVSKVIVIPCDTLATFFNSFGTSLSSHVPGFHHPVWRPGVMSHHRLPRQV